MFMSERPTKRYLFASDFDHTLTFNDSGYVLSELLGIPTDEFERKATGMAKLNFVQQGAELAYLLLHDPEFRIRVRKEHLHEVGKRIRLKQNIELLSQVLDHGIKGFHFDFYVVSAAPVEVIQSALEGIVARDHIFGTEFRYKADGEIDTLVRATAGYGKVAALDRLQTQLQIGPSNIVYVGDGSSDLHVMLHVNVRDGFTIAVPTHATSPRWRSAPFWVAMPLPSWCRCSRKLWDGHEFRSVNSSLSTASLFRSGSLFEPIG